MQLRSSENAETVLMAQGAKTVAAGGGMAAAGADGPATSPSGTPARLGRTDEISSLFGESDDEEAGADEVTKAQKGPKVQPRKRAASLAGLTFDDGGGLTNSKKGGAAGRKSTAGAPPVAEDQCFSALQSMMTAVKERKRAECSEKARACLADHKAKVNAALTQLRGSVDGARKRLVQQKEEAAAASAQLKAVQGECVQIMSAFLLAAKPKFAAAESLKKKVEELSGMAGHQSETAQIEAQITKCEAHCSGLNNATRKKLVALVEQATASNDFKTELLKMIENLA